MQPNPSSLSCRPISFPPMSCVAATWVCVVAVMASPANHLGVRMTSASSVLGSTWVGAVLAACVVSRVTGPMEARACLPTFYAV
jgi:hypothetical protein